MIKIALNQTRLIEPHFLDEANRPAEFEGSLTWQLGPTNIASLYPVPGMTTTNIRGDATGKATLRLLSEQGALLASEDVCVFDPGPEPWDTAVVRAELHIG